MKNQPNWNSIYNTVQRVEAENAIRELIGDDYYETGKYNPQIMDDLYNKLREYMLDREYTTQAEHEMLAKLMELASYEIH